MGPDPAVAAVRSAVRSGLAAVPAGGLVLAAVSGGTDSLALLAAVAWEAPRAGLRWGVLHVDHQLQPGSAAQAGAVAALAREHGAATVRVLVAAPDPSAPGGPEARARALRYRALDEAATDLAAHVVLLGHTLDDQAETVLLGLARGSGARSLAGMPARRGRYARPLLGLGRDTTSKACAALGLVPWDDPSNADPALLRNRVRHDVLPLLETALGPGVALALARTAGLLRQDADLLDELAAEAAEACRDGAALRTPALAGLHPALRSRVLRRWLAESGAADGSLSERHVRAAEALVTAWRGQGAVSLPGGLVALRRCDRLVVEPPAPDPGVQ